MTERLVLGSGSAIRAKILSDAGVSFEVMPATVDEAALKSRMAGQPGEAIAQALADAKALDVSRRTDAIVLGSDQILRFQGRLFDKPLSREEGRERLWGMRGAPHELIGGVTVAQNGDVLHRHLEVSRLHMRDFSEGFLTSYFDKVGDAVLKSVGCYEYEGLGAQLFDRVEGDYFAILGLPLAPVLRILRSVNVLQA